MSDLIDYQKNGYLARSFDSEYLSQGIKCALENEERWKELSLHARRKVEENFDIRVVSRKYRDLYNDILGKK